MSFEALKQPTISPARWQGERDCTIGPFSGQKVALYFAAHVLNVGDAGVTSGAVFAKRDAWFVEVSSYLPSPTVEHLHSRCEGRKAHKV